VAEARRAGKLAPGKILLDSTSGNTGIAYAIGAALGFPVTLCVPENVSPERKRILQAYGASIIYTDPAEGSPRIKFTTESRRHRENLFLISSVPRCFRGEMVMQADF
jgi:cysteine synthase